MEEDISEIQVEVERKTDRSGTEIDVPASYNQGIISSSCYRNSIGSIHILSQIGLTSYNRRAFFRIIIKSSST